MAPLRELITSKLGLVVIGGLLISTLLLVFASREANRQTEEAEAGVSRKLEELNTSLEEARNTRNALQRDLDQMTRERVDLDGKMTRLEKDLEAKTKAETDANARVTSTETRLQEATSRNETLVAELETVRTEAKADLDAQEAEIAELKKRTEAETLEWAETRGHLEQQLTEARRRLADLSAVPAQLEIAALKDRIVSLEQKLDTLGNQRNELARSLRVLRESVTPPKPAAPPTEGPAEN